MKNKNSEIKKVKKAVVKEVPVVDVYSLSGKMVDKFKLDAEIFNAKINKPLLHEAILMYRANERQGNSSTKTRGEVSGGGKKPWRQKGTGRARAGSIRSPLWRGGAIVFGPKPRDYSFSLPKKMLRLALISSLSAKLKDNDIIVLEKDPEMAHPKTKEIVKILNSLKSGEGRVLFLSGKRDENLLFSCRNIKNVCLKASDEFNAYDVLKNGKLIFSKDTHSAIVKRLSDNGEKNK